LTTNGLTLIHCAAQFDRGTLSIETFLQKEYGLQVDALDNFKCTPLHFAVLNM